MKECNLKEMETENIKLSSKYTYYHVPHNYTKENEINV